MNGVMTVKDSPLRIAVNMQTSAIVGMVEISSEEMDKLTKKYAEVSSVPGYWSIDGRVWPNAADDWKVWKPISD